jgi:hypothetical protein
MKTLQLLIVFLIFGFSYSQTISERDLLFFIANNNTEANVSQIVQIGDLNRADVNAPQITLVQNGSNQEFYFNETSQIPSNISVEMNGYNNYLEILGTNQLTENMKITVNGDFKSIIIRNYP